MKLCRKQKNAVADSSKTATAIKIYFIYQSSIPNILLENEEIDVFFDYIDVVVEFNDGTTGTYGLWETITYGDDEFSIDWTNDTQIYNNPWTVGNTYTEQVSVGGVSTDVDMPHEGQEFGYVIDGEIVLVIDKKEYTCRKGESFYFTTDKNHYIKNIKNKDAKVIWISSPPNF